MVNNIEIIRLKTIIRKNNIIEKENKNKSIIAVNIVANFYKAMGYNNFNLSKELGIVCINEILNSIGEKNSKYYYYKSIKILIRELKLNNLNQ
jgi:hypothetical protein